MAPAALKNFLWPLVGLLALRVVSLNAPEGFQEEDEVDAQHRLGGMDHPLTKEQLRSLHAKFDKNSDGKVSFREVMDFAQQISKAMAVKSSESLLEATDTNKDGLLSLQEHLNDSHYFADLDPEAVKQHDRIKAIETKKFKAADENGDEILGPQEITALLYPETHPGVLEVAVREIVHEKDHDGDGLLTAKEFWSFEEGDSEPELSEEEMKDFETLDKDKSGTLDTNELKAWESGVFHTEATVMKLMEICDKDGDTQCTIEELENAREKVVDSDAHYELTAWAKHHEL